MKMIYVYGDSDFAAIDFVTHFKGNSVSEIINIYENGFTHTDFEVEIKEFSDIDPKFIQFIRQEIQDYDFAKHENFYFENEIIK